MLLRSIHLSIWNYPTEIKGPFSFETRCLCNFVQRHIQTLKIHTPDFSRIVISSDLKDIAVNSAGALGVPFAPDIERYRCASPFEKQQYFIEVLTDGLLRANELHPLPLVEINAAIQKFVDNGYENNWTHTSKRFHKQGIAAELICRLTMTEFRLALVVTSRNGKRQEKTIFTSPPDEIFFHHEFKELIIRADSIVVTKRPTHGDELVCIPLSQFLEAAEHG